MPRQQIKDEYDITGEIGTGGMAIVYKAVQKSLDRPVAIKELKKSYHADDQIVKRFERESRVAASLQHENIVHIYDYWRKPDYSIVMEYVDGTDLAGIIEKTGPLPVDVGTMIAVQVCNALDYAHMRGLIHRDIKPSNIMIKRNGEVKLMDFGIAHTRNLEALTVPGTFIGTPAYMSPEQIIGQQLDSRSDIFSFGIVLYEMFTGAKPFMDDEVRPVSAKILKDGFRAPRRINSDVPRSLQRIIKKCLRKKPQKRYDSMLEVETRLGKRLAGRTTKSASLHRIADYLVSMNVFEADMEKETVIITSKVPTILRYRRAFLSGAMLFLLAAGAALFYIWAKANQAWTPPAAIPYAQPQESTPPTLTAPVTSLKGPANTPTSSQSSAIEKSKEPAPSARKKTGTSKKKKKKRT